MIQVKPWMGKMGTDMESGLKAVCYSVPLYSFTQKSEIFIKSWPANRE